MRPDTTYPGRLVDEGADEDGNRTFVFYGYNPHNGEPLRPVEIALRPDSQDVDHLVAESKKDETTCAIRDGSAILGPGTGPEAP